MAPTILQLRPDLNAAAYLIEIMIAEALFLRPYKKRENFAARYIASGLLLLVLGTVTGIPSLAGFPRFLWFFAAMAGCIAAVCFCYEEDIFTLTSACVAGFAAQHIANKFTILLGLVPMIKWIADQSVTMHAVFEILVFSYVYLVIFMIFGRHRTNAKSNLHLQLLSLVIVFTCIGVNRLVVDQAVGNIYFEIAACLYAIMCCVFAVTLVIFAVLSPISTSGVYGFRRSTLRFKSRRFSSSPISALRKR